MVANRTTIAAPVEAEFLAQPASLRDWVAAYLRADPWVNGIIATGILIGFYHGWLKLRFHHPVVTFLFDFVLGLALALTFLKLDRKVAFIPQCKIGSALKLFYAVCLIYIFLPWGPPFLINISAARGWCFASLMFCLGYHITRNSTQAKSYFYLLIGLGLLTAIYGLRQSPEEIFQRMKEDEVFADRYFNTTYISPSGTQQVRIFSTFVSAAAFGGTLANVIFISFALMSEPKQTWRMRALLLAAMAPMVYAMILTGSRSSMIMLAIAVLIIAVFRRNFKNFLVVPAVLFIMLKMAASLTEGGTAERYGSILNADNLITRSLIPIRIGAEYMLENPLGGGLGKSGTGVPLFLLKTKLYDDFKGADGDLGRLMIEMGLVGLLCFGRLIFVCLKSSYDHLLLLKDTPLCTFALVNVAFFVNALICLPSGSPFLGIPIGALIWFFLGTLQKLSEQYRAVGGVTPAPAMAPPPAPTKKFLYYQPRGQAAIPPSRVAQK